VCESLALMSAPGRKGTLTVVTKLFTKGAFCKEPEQKIHKNQAVSEDKKLTSNRRIVKSNNNTPPDGYEQDKDFPGKPEMSKNLRYWTKNN
jgi:hypothetical protein